jgi:hypothetical protein
METENKVKVCIKGGMFNGGLAGQHDVYKKAKEEAEKKVLKYSSDLFSSAGHETPKLVLTSIFDFVNNEIDCFKDHLSEDDQFRLQCVVDGVYERVEFAKILIDILDEQDRINVFDIKLEMTEKGVLM